MCSLQSGKAFPSLPTKGQFANRFGTTPRSTTLEWKVNISQMMNTTYNNSKDSERIKGNPRSRGRGGRR
jgi:hypothetical protein